MTGFTIVDTFKEGTSRSLSTSSRPPPLRSPRQPRSRYRFRPSAFVRTTLGDILRSGGKREEPPPSAPLLLPASWFVWTPTARKASLRLERAQKVRNMLAASRVTPPIRLPDVLQSAQDHRTNAEQGFPQGAVVNNAVPFSSLQSSPSQTTTTIAATTTTNAGSKLFTTSTAIPESLLSPIPSATHFRAVLPWLLTAPGYINQSTAEYLASELALSSVQIVDLSSILLTSACATGADPPPSSSSSSVSSHSSVSGTTMSRTSHVSYSGRSWKIAPDVAWVGPTQFPTPTVATAAILHRVSHRCGGIRNKPPEIGGSAAVLSYRPNNVNLAAEALAIYFYIFCGLRPKDALEAAGSAVRCPPPHHSVLESAVEELAAISKGWLQRVILEWPYGGGHVEVSGDAVGSWDHKAPLWFNVRQRKWRLQLWGLPPGLYAFKYIVDGSWCIDVAAPSSVDQFGNANNVCLVPACSGGQFVDSAQVATDADGMAGQWQAIDADNEVDRRSMDEVETAARHHSMTEKEEIEDDTHNSGDTKVAIKEVSEEERQKYARFGAHILAYYSKSCTLNKQWSTR